jgi:5'-methylthioadenosine phosphorylase
MAKAETRIHRTPFAIISGSAGWGVPFPDGVKLSGVKVLERNLTFETPWGPSANWQVLEIDGVHTPDKRTRTVLNVFSHGWPLDSVDHSAHRRVGWILREAGARKVLSDSTCGSLNKFLQPRDFIIPADVIDLSQTTYPLSEGRFKHLVLSSQLFCPHLAATLERTARELWLAPGRVLGHAFEIVAAHNWGPRFSSAAEARAYQRLGADAINQSIGAEATVMREIGACFVSASYIVRHQDAIAPKFAGDPIDEIHHDLAEISVRISLLAIARAELSNDCGCSALRVERPDDYAINAQGRRSP